MFEAGIREGGACNVMASYNSIDSDVVMCSHKYLTDILKNELGAQGYARSDWGGIGRIRRLHHLVRDDRDALCLAIGNGLDVQGCDLDNQYFEETLVSLVKEGRLPMERVDDAVRRVLRMKFRLGLFPEGASDRRKEGMEHGRMFGSRDLCGAIVVIVRMIRKMQDTT